MVWDNFISLNHPITIICKRHGAFEQLAKNHIKGHGCPHCVHIVSKPEIAWLDSLSVPQKYRHKTISIRKQKYNLDAFNPNINTIYEFYGDYWHGNPLVYDANKIHPIRKLTFGSLYENTLQREISLKNDGYQIISIWEYDWNKLTINKPFP